MRKNILDSSVTCTKYILKYLKNMQLLVKWKFGFLFKKPVNSFRVQLISGICLEMPLKDMAQAIIIAYIRSKNRKLFPMSLFTVVKEFFDRC